MVTQICGVGHRWRHHCSRPCEYFSPNTGWCPGRCDHDCTHQGMHQCSQHHGTELPPMPSRPPPRDDDPAPDNCPSASSEHGQRQPCAFFCSYVAPWGNRCTNQCGVHRGHPGPHLCGRIHNVQPPPNIPRDLADFDNLPPNDPALHSFFDSLPRVLPKELELVCASCTPEPCDGMPAWDTLEPCNVPPTSDLGPRDSPPASGSLVSSCSHSVARGSVHSRWRLSALSDCHVLPDSPLIRLVLQSSAQPLSSPQAESMSEQARWDVLETAIRNHPLRKSGRRTNLVPSGERDPTGKFLKHRVPSETLRAGPVVDACRALLPHIDVSEVQLNKFQHASHCQPHYDRANQGESLVALLGSFTDGGALVTESGLRFTEKRVWHRFDGSKDKHWIEPWSSSEDRFSVVIFSRGKPLGLDPPSAHCPSPCAPPVSLSPSGSSCPPVVDRPLGASGPSCSPPASSTLRFQWEAGEGATQWQYPDVESVEYKEALVADLEARRLESYAHLSDEQWNRLLGVVRDHSAAFQLKGAPPTVLKGYEFDIELKPGVQRSHCQDA